VGSHHKVHEEKLDSPWTSGSAVQGTRNSSQEDSTRDSATQLTKQHMAKWFVHALIFVYAAYNI
jgi:hypothetical protein